MVVVGPVGLHPCAVVRELRLAAPWWSVVVVTERAERGRYDGEPIARHRLGEVEVAALALLGATTVDRSTTAIRAAVAREVGRGSLVWARPVKRAGAARGSTP